MNFNIRLDQLLLHTKTALTEQTETIEKAINILAETIKSDGILHLIAGDMSSAGVFETFIKPGCLCAFSPVTEPTLSTMHSASRAYYLRDSAKVGEYLVSSYRNIKKGDCLILADVCGSVASEEIIEFAVSNDLPIIYISGAVKNNKSTLHIELPKTDEPNLYSNNSVSLASLMNALNLAVIDTLSSTDKQPDIWAPFMHKYNEFNEQLIEKYRYRIKQL